MVQIDISLPQSCDDCPFLLVDYKTNVPDCDLMEDLPNCPEYNWNTPMGQKDKNCPLREVPEIIHCHECKYAEVADKDDNQDGYTCPFHRGSIWFSGSYCSWAERR